MESSQVFHTFKSPVIFQHTLEKMDPLQTEIYLQSNILPNNKVGIACNRKIWAQEVLLTGVTATLAENSGNGVLLISNMVNNPHPEKNGDKVCY